MAQIVAGFGVPHTPVFPFFVKRDGPDCEIAKLFGAQKEELAAARPDLIVMFDTDHLNTFFLNDLPIFALGIDKSFKAPNDEPRDVPNYTVKSSPGLAAHIRAAMKADPAKALATLDLTDEERRCLLAGDVGQLYRKGEIQSRDRAS